MDNISDRIRRYLSVSVGVFASLKFGCVTVILWIRGTPIIYSEKVTVGFVAYGLKLLYRRVLSCSKCMHFKTSNKYMKRCVTEKLLSSLEILPLDSGELQFACDMYISKWTFR